MMIDMIAGRIQVRYHDLSFKKFSIHCFALKNSRISWPCDVRKDKQDLVFRTHRWSIYASYKIYYRLYGIICHVVSSTIWYRQVQAFLPRWWKRNSVSSHLPEAVISLRLSVLTFTPPPRRHLTEFPGERSKSWPLTSLWSMRHHLPMH